MDILIKSDHQATKAETKQYQSIIGSLNYANTVTRPDLALAISMLSQFLNNPDHHDKALRAVTYAGNTSDHSLHYHADDQHGLWGHVDASSYASGPDSKSRCGYVFFFAGGPISWKSKLQSSTAKSSAEAEYMGLSVAGSEAIWLSQLLRICDSVLFKTAAWQYYQSIRKSNYQISDHQVVKWGPDVMKEEAENQRIAYELVDNRIVHIPRVGEGYRSVGRHQRHKKVASVLDYFATLRHDIPGPLSGGICRGLLFPETEDLVFDSLDEMEKWFNSRLFAHNPKLISQGCELVLCHLDIAPRNILWQEDGSLCLIDWASAGYYPRLFEFCAQWIIEGKDGEFNSLLLKSMSSLPYQEMAQKESVLSEPKIQILPEHYQEIHWIVFLHHPIQCQIIRQAGMNKLSGKALPPQDPQDPLLSLLHAPLQELENKIEFTVASLIFCAQFGLRTLNHLMLRSFG
ncbi:kinase-like protein [Penicillium sp. DV-2018c]|nr:kinase-like protein [Penicillium sp. DV-2018c]